MYIYIYIITYTFFIYIITFLLEATEETKQARAILRSRGLPRLVSIGNGSSRRLPDARGNTSRNTRTTSSHHDEKVSGPAASKPYDSQGMYI